MPSVLLTYGLNPLVGLKLLIKSPEQVTWSSALQKVIPTIQSWISEQPRMQISVGSLVPEEAPHFSKLQLLTRLQFFIAIDTESEGALPALPSGRSTAIQVYRHSQGSESYRTQIVRFHIGSRKGRVRRV